MPAMPPLPPGMGAQSPQPQQAPQPNLMQLAGMGGGQQGPMGQTPGMTSGMSQISEAVVRMGAEIDQALKLLAQTMPQLAPWVEKTTLELRYQIGTAMNAGAMPTNPTPNDQESFPDGGGRL